MKPPRPFAYMLLGFLLAGVVSAQEPSPPDSPPKRLVEALPHDKTPEQLLALVALNLGVEEFKTGAIDRAIHYFVESKRLDPDLINARLYLATAYASQYLPGDISEPNLSHRDAALQEFRDTLKTAPENLSALDGLGSILFQSANVPLDASKYRESLLLFRKHTRLAPNDPEPYYWIGVIDWTTSFRFNKDIRAKFRASSRDAPLSDSDPLPPDLRRIYAAECAPVIDEGIESIKQAMALRPEYEDAMAYLNLLYRRKADVVENAEERAALLKMADDLIDKVKEIKQKKVMPAK